MEELYHYGVKGMKWRHHKPSEDSERRDKENRKRLAQKKTSQHGTSLADRRHAQAISRLKQQRLMANSADSEKADYEKSKTAQVGDGKYTNAYVERQNLRDRAERANGGIARKKQANTSHRAKALRRERSRRRGLEYVKRYQSSSYKKV